MSNYVSLNTAEAVIRNSFKEFSSSLAKKPAVILRGAPGCAKSALPVALAKELGCDMWQVHGVAHEGVELLGIPLVNKGKQSRAMTDLLPVAADFNGFLVIEEYGNCDATFRKGVHHLIHDRKLSSGYEVPDGAMIIVTTNSPDDQTGAVALEPTIMSRAYVFDLQHDSETWVDYQSSRGGNPLVLAWVKQKPEAIYCKPKQKGESFPNYRTWEMASTALNLFPNDPGLYEPMIRGAIGAEHAREFLEFLRLREHMIPLSEVAKNPGKCEIPSRTDIAYLMIYSLNNATLSGTVSMAEATKYIKRFSMEFRQVWVSLVKGDSRATHPAFTKLCVDNGMTIFKSGVY